MSDNVAITAGTGTTIGADDVGGVLIQRVKTTWGPDGTANDADVATGKPFPVQLRGSDGTDRSNALLVIGSATTCKVSITRPSDTTPYAANDCWSDSTSAPTSGGFTLTGAARISGGSGIITDMLVVSSIDPATLLQGEIWLADSAVTNVNDNSAFAMSDSDLLLLAGIVPFTLASTIAGSGTNSFAHLQGLNIGFTCIGSANLRFLVKVKNAYTPASAEVLSVCAKIVQTN